MTFDLAQAEQLAAVVDKSDVVFALTHNYTGYPLVAKRQEQMIMNGELGEIQAVRANYIQGWLRTRLEDLTRNKQRGERIHQERRSCRLFW